MDHQNQGWILGALLVSVFPDGWCKHRVRSMIFGGIFSCNVLGNAERCCRCSMIWWGERTMACRICLFCMANCYSGCGRSLTRHFFVSAQIPWSSSSSFCDVESCTCLVSQFWFPEKLCSPDLFLSLYQMQPKKKERIRRFFCLFAVLIALLLPSD